jgi:centrosomal protein CEP76
MFAHRCVDSLVFTVAVDTSKRQLYLQLLNGKAFLEYLTMDSNLDSGDEYALVGQPQTAYFNIYVHFRGQRFKTRAFSCSCEPRINEGFLLELNKSASSDQGGSGQLMADSAALLSITDPIHLVMIRTDLNGDTHLVSSYFMEWRSVLTFAGNKQTVAIELMGKQAANLSGTPIDFGLLTF